MKAPAILPLGAPVTRGVVLHAPGATRDRRLSGELAATQVFEAIGLQAWQIALAARAEPADPARPIEPAEAQAAIRVAEHFACMVCYGSEPRPSAARLDLTGSLH